MLETPMSVDFQNDEMPIKVEPLNFDEIRQIQKKSLQKKTKVVETLSEKEAEDIEYYVNDISRYIRKYAEKGDTKFQYDCSPLTQVCFLALAERFKTLNPRFFVVTQLGSQVLTVDWSNKNEV